MSSSFQKRDFNDAKAMLDEAGLLFVRAWRLKNNKDYSGSVEASQHSGELSIKCLYKMVGLEHPKSHDPGKDLDKVLDQFKKLRDDEEDIEEDTVFSRLQFLSNLLERFHNEGFYGYKGTPASKILKETDATYIYQCGLEILGLIGITLLLFGFKNNFLNSKEKNAVESIAKYFIAPQL